MSKAPEDIHADILVLRAQQHDATALAQLVNRWHPPLAAHAQRLLNNRTAAEEVMQDVWIAIVRGIGKLQNPAAFRYWAYRIVGRESANWIKRRQCTRRDGNADGLAAIAHDDAPSTDNAALHNALARLPLQHREVLLLHYLEGMSVEQVAIALGANEGTIKSRLHYAREHLRSAMRGRDHD